MSFLVSIIIPFCNEEKYLANAINSVLNQTYAYTEIILVNDGSTDNSLSIAQDFGEKHKNIILISTANKGLGHARNVGMAVSTGEYISFLDSDDELKEGAILLWVDKILNLKGDIVVSKFNIVHAGIEGFQMSGGWKGDGRPCYGMDAIEAIYENRLTCTAWGKLYKASIAKQLHFPEGYWFEDRPFLVSYFLKVNKVVFDESCQLNILSREESITRRLISERRIKDGHAMYLLELDIASRISKNKKLVSLINSHYLNILIETLIILYYDDKKLSSSKLIKKCYAEYTTLFVLQLRKTSTKISIGTTANLLFLQLHKVLGWKLLFLILPICKRKKCKTILLLKSY